MQLRRITMPLMSAVAMMVSMGVANATLQLTLTSGLTTQTVSSGSCPGPACFVSFIGSVGNWQINLTSGAGAGALVGPTLDVNSLDTTFSGSTDDLMIKLVEDGLTLAPGYNGVIDGNGNVGSIMYQAFTGTTLASIPNMIGSTGALVGPSYHGVLGGVSGAGDSALAEVITIHSLAPGTTSFNANLSPVPEPASVMLLGGILLFTVSAVRRKVGRPV
jgi:hypothetical protein